MTLTGSDNFNALTPITLSLSDGKPVPSVRTHTWLPADCKGTATRVKCLSPDRLERATFKTSPRAPTTWKFKAKFKKQNLTGPVEGPTTAHLIYGPLDRPHGQHPGLQVEGHRAHLPGHSVSDGRRGSCGLDTAGRDASGA